MKKVLVFFGGESCEHDVSVITGVMALNVIDKTAYDPIPIYVTKSGEWKTGEELKNLSFYKNADVKKLKTVTVLSGDNNLYSLSKDKLKSMGEIYCALNCTHGGSGEAGGLFAVLEQSKIPCTSAPLFASSLAMDKEFTKIALSGLGVKFLPCVKITVDNYYLRKQMALKLITKKIKFPMIIKPANLGSSIGIRLAKDEDELEKGLNYAFTFDTKVIVENMLEKPRELNCAAYKKGGEIIVSEVEEPIKLNDVLSFSDKYLGEGEKVFPADIPEELREKIRNTTSIVYRKLGFGGVIRIDYMFFEGDLYLNEINTVPGSLAYYLFCEDIQSFPQFVSDLIEEGVDAFKNGQNKCKTFDGKLFEFSSARLKK